LLPPTTEVTGASLLSPAVREAAADDPALPLPLLQPVRSTQATAAVTATARTLGMVAVMDPQSSYPALVSLWTALGGSLSTNRRISNRHLLEPLRDDGAPHPGWRQYRCRPPHHIAISDQ
jgi:hypothetical protein